MLYRILTSDDAEAFQKIRLKGLREEPSAFASSYEEECDRPLSVVASRLEPTGLGAVWGAFFDSRLVGITGVRREEHTKLAHKAFVWGVYVNPGHRQNGIGRELLTRSLDYAFSKLGVRQVNLGVNHANLSARSLYESIGFEEFALERDFLLVDGEFYDELHMVCRREDYAQTAAIKADSA